MKYIDYVVEYSKIFIGLSSLLLGGSIAFVVKVGNVSFLNSIILIGVWIFFVLSIYYGAQVIRQITIVAFHIENEETASEDDDDPIPLELTIFGKGVSEPKNLQLLFFLIGIILFGILAIITAGSSVKSLGNDSCAVQHVPASPSEEK